MRTKNITPIMIALFLVSILGVASIFQVESLRPSDLVGLWHLDEGAGSTAYDSSSFGNDGTIVGPVAWVDGYKGKALGFNGVSGYVEVPDAPSLDATNGLTLAAWVYYAGSAAAQHPISKPHPTKEHWSCYMLCIIGDSYDGAKYYLPDSILFVLSFDNGDDDILFYTDPMPRNTWTHLAATYDGHYMKLYINGEEAASKKCEGKTIITSNYPLYIGTHDSDQPWWKPAFHGNIDEVQVWSVGLTAAQVGRISRR